MLLEQLLNVLVGKVEGVTIGCSIYKASESNLKNFLLNLVHQETYSNHLGEKAYNLLLHTYQQSSQRPEWPEELEDSDFTDNSMENN